MYILSNSFLLFKIKFVENTDLLELLGPVIIHLTGCFGYNFFPFFIID